MPSMGDTEVNELEPGGGGLPLQNVEKRCHGAFMQGFDCGVGGDRGGSAPASVGTCSDLVRSDRSPVSWSKRQENSSREGNTC